MLPNCEECKYCDDIEHISRNRQFDKIYCDRAKQVFERRMKPWHCPFSPICNKDNLLIPNSCEECPYSNNEFCNITGKDMMISTSSFDKECPLRSGICIKK